MDASDAWRYTANSALAEGTQLIIGQTQQTDGVRGWYGAAVLPVFYSGSLGVFTKSEAAAREYGEPGVFGLSLAKYYEEYGFGLGGHFAFWESGISRGGTNSFGAFGVDLRLDPYYDFSGRAYYLNAGVPMRLRSSSLRERLADQYGAAINYHPMRDSLWDVDLGVGARKTGNEALVLGVSAECSYLRTAFVRMGYENPVDRGVNAAGLTAGLGLFARGFGLDFAYRFGSVNSGGGVWAADAKLHIESLKRRSADDNLALAQDYFSSGRYQKASVYARRAMKTDTAHWEARAMHVTAEAEARRAGGQKIAIIYGGNSRGLVIPYPPSPDALGGISRHAALVSSLREAWPRHFAIDVGNFMGGANPLQVELAAAYYDLANFDAIAPGGGELAMGPSEFMSAQRRALPVVITNLEFSDPAEEPGELGRKFPRLKAFFF